MSDEKDSLGPDQNRWSRSWRMLEKVGSSIGTALGYVFAAIIYGLILTIIFTPLIVHYVIGPEWAQTVGLVMIFLSLFVILQQTEE